MANKQTDVQERREKKRLKMRKSRSLTLGKNESLVEKKRKGKGERSWKNLKEMRRFFLRESVR
jgi:hypothetical protein